MNHCCKCCPSQPVHAPGNEALDSLIQYDPGMVDETIPATSWWEMLLYLSLAVFGICMCIYLLVRFA